MKTNRYANGSRGEPQLGDVEVHLTPEYARELLAMSVRRTRKRAAKLLSELLRIAQEPEPDMERVRQLAEGIQFESNMARELARAAADPGDRSDLGFGLAV